MVEGVGRGETRWEGGRVESEACLGGSAPSFRLSFYAAFPAPPAPSFTDSSCIS